MQRFIKTVLGASMAALVTAGAAYGAPQFQPAQPATLQAIEKFDRAWAPGIASALDAYGIPASEVAWVRVTAQNGGTGMPRAYDVAVGLRGKPGTINIRLGMGGEVQEVYAMHGAVLPQR